MEVAENDGAIVGSITCSGRDSQAFDVGNSRVYIAELLANASDAAVVDVPSPLIAQLSSV